MAWSVNDVNVSEELRLSRGPRWLLDHKRHSLRLGSDEVDPVAPSTSALARYMLAAMYREEGGVGLAAPMLGLGSRLIVLKVDQRQQVMVNPRIVETEGDVEAGVEANLCLPYVWASVGRQRGLVVEFESLSGARSCERVDGWSARVIAHEVELLEGHFFLDHVNDKDIHCRTPEGATDAALDTEQYNKPLEGSDTMPRLSVVTLPLELLDLPGSILRRRAEAVELDSLGTEQLRWLVREMFVLQHHLEGVGLAAPQVGISLRIAVIHNVGEDPVVLLNPELLDRSDETEEGLEGCLSLPWLTGPVARARSVKVRTHGLDGDAQIVEAGGYLARVIQHEIDHLDGILYTDHLDSLSQLNRVDPQTLADKAMASLLQECEQSSSEQPSIIT
jgi:peptide deformylase